MTKHSGYTLAVHVTPRSGRDVVTGVRDDGQGRDEVCVRVKAAPADGEANKAVCRTLAASIDVPKSRVSVTAGQTARRKTIAVECSREQLDAWLAGLPRL